MRDCNRKICKNFLTMHHLSAPEKLKDKRDAVAAHRKLTKEWSHDLKHVKVQQCVCSGQKLAAQVMTSDYTNNKKLKNAHTKYLN